MTAPITSRTLILGREPAMLAEVVASALVVAHLFLLPGLNEPVQAAINAFLLAAASVYTAVKVRSDALLPLLTGAFKAGVALLVTFGVPLDTPQQAALLTTLSLVTGLFVRSQVLAPITVDGEVLYTR
jgi:hypothetical protein